jgi:hypothetical protein
MISRIWFVLLIHVCYFADPKLPKSPREAPVIDLNIRTDQPKILWRAKVGRHVGPFTKSGDKLLIGGAFATGNSRGTEPASLLCLSDKEGSLIWQADHSRVLRWAMPRCRSVVEKELPDSMLSMAARQQKPDPCLDI